MIHDGMSGTHASYTRHSYAYISHQTASPLFVSLAGQAFAKHYNPLLSGETSHGSQYSSDKNAVAMRRFGEAAQLNSHSSSPAQDSSTAGVHCTATSRYTAPPNQAMHAAHDPTTSPAAAAQMETYQNVDRPTDAGQDQADWGPGNPHVVRGQGVAAQGRDGQGGAGGCEKGLQGVLGQSSKQSSLGRQLGDALKLRKWKPNRQPDLTPLADSTSPRPGPSLSPRTESAMMLAASELGFDAKQGGNVGQSAKPTLPGSPSEAVQ